jgi:hypothetical protein
VFKRFEIWTARIMLVVLLLVSTGQGEAVASPRKWAKKSGHAVLSFTGEMARFYTATAVVTYWECARTRDPIKCQIFLHSLEDIHTYAGFAIFVAASRATGFATYHLSQGRLGGQFLGMAAGLFSSELYQEFREHPKVEELLASRDPARYHRILNELWQDFLANPEWWEGKVPNLVGLFGGTFAGALTIPLISKTARGSEVLLDLTKAKQKSALAVRAAKAMKKTRAWLRFYKLVASGRASNPALWLTGELGMMILFLKYSEWIENPARIWWNDRQGFHYFKEKLNVLESRMNPAEIVNPSFDWAKAVRDVELAWDDYRSAQILKAKTVQAEYQGELSRLDQQMITPYFYYLWFVDGMRSDSSVIRNNAFGWKPGDDEEVQNYLRSFFCGPAPDKALKRAQVIWNMPVPGHGQDEIEPFSVVREDRACEPLRAPWSDDSMDRILFHKKRVQLISSGKYTAEQVEDAQSRIIEHAEPVRKSLIERYQKSLKEVLLQVMDSTEVRSSVPALHKGILASCNEEEAYWKRWDQEYGSQTKVFREALGRVRQKQAVVQELRQYLVDSGNSQKQFEEELFAEAFAEDPARSSIQKWKSFMLINRSASP